jgi:bacterial/archaeal transporter family-2 protein
MDRLLAVTLTLCVGGLVAFQPPANALLARHVGDLGAAFASLVISTAIVGSLLVTVGDPGDLGRLPKPRLEYVIGGIAGAAIVYVTIVTVKSLGAGGVAAALVCAQLVVAALIDRLGWLGLDETPLNAHRLAGMALLIAGTLLLTTR